MKTEEEKKEYQRIWRDNNRDKLKKYHREWKRKKRITNPGFERRYRSTTKGILITKLADIKRRCYNKKFKHFKHYGGRGIFLCDEWLNNSESFYKWAIENGFKKGLEIDRIDNDGNYEPENCRWVTRQENCRNTRRCVTDFVNETRICRKCKIKKHKSEFNKDKTQALGIKYICRACKKNT